MAQRRELYRGDCLEILEQYIEKKSVDLVYLDPPFNSKSNYTLPFKMKDKSLKPVEAFTDFWEWTIDDDVLLDKWKRSYQEPKHSIAAIIEFAYQVERKFGKSRRRKYNLAAYLLNMAQRLISIRHVLKDTGSIFLHCDPTAGHYLKLIMDAIFERQSFRNEIIWCYTGPGSPKMRQFNRKHDTIFWYSIGKKWVFNREAIRIPHKDGGPHAGGFKGTDKKPDDPEYGVKGKIPETWWNYAIAARSKTEYLGYPTQKPLKLLERIIRASSNPGDLVLDPFCGCGTAAHAAELLDRSWIGIDISRFSTELIRERVIDNFPARLSHNDIKMFRLPETVFDARKLASEDAFEFEKWACGAIGANGMYKDLGRPGPDSGIDGVMEIKTIHNGNVQDDTVIIQVKGGHVSPDSVKALSETVRRRGSIAGIMLCFKDQMGTVNNQRNREMWHDDSGTYPVIQGFTTEDMLAGKRPLLPPRYGIRRGGRTSA